MKRFDAVPEIFPDCQSGTLTFNTLTFTCLSGALKSLCQNDER